MQVSANKELKALKTERTLVDIDQIELQSEIDKMLNGPQYQFKSKNSLMPVKVVFNNLVFKKNLRKQK